MIQSVSNGESQPGSVLEYFPEALTVSQMLDYYRAGQAQRQTLYSRHPDYSAGRF